MPKLRRLSGVQVVAIFHIFGFAIAGQKGSHVKLSRIIDGRRQILTIPNHKEIDTGTLRAIYRMTPESVTLLKKVSVTFYELDKKYGSLQKAFEDDRPDNPFYCLKRQEFVPHRLEAFQAKMIWAGEPVEGEGKIN